MNRKVVILCLCVWMLPIQAQEEQEESKQMDLHEVEVIRSKNTLSSEAYQLITQVSKVQIEALPIQTIADILQYLPGVDIRTRGANGAQADISMRGGTFDQVLVLLNGVSINDFHTGHYALNIPITSSMIERIEVLQGTSARLFGAFSGAINIITKQPQSNSKSHEIMLTMTAGMNNLVHPEIAASTDKKDVHLNIAADYSRADGYYAPNPSEKEATACRNSDYQLANIYVQTAWRGLDVQIGTQWKDAGAGMFYGFGSQDQFDATRTAFASAKYTHHWKKWRLETLAAYRANYDRYEWHRGQTLYSNHHLSQTASAAISAHYVSRIGTTSFGLGIRNENMRSTNLGDTINTLSSLPLGDNRLHLNYYMEQSFNYAGLSASIGLNGTYNSSFGHHLGGNVNLGYTFTKAGTVYIHANRSLRLPTFTDLYYNAGNQLGNRYLQPETAWLLSIGYKNTWKGLTVAADGYYRWGTNIIDWIFTPEDIQRPYHAQNQQRVNAAGMEISVAYRWNEWIPCISVDYAYTYLDLDLKESGSRYLDYLRHKLTLHLEHGIYKGFGAAWTVRFQQREGQFNNAQGEVCDYQPVWLLDGMIFWKNKQVRISAECTNITNSRYYDYGGILQPGAWAKLSICARF